MRKIKDILRLRYEAGLPYRGIANALNIGYGTVVDYLNRAQRAGLGWPVPEGTIELHPLNGRNPKMVLVSIGGATISR